MPSGGRYRTDTTSYVSGLACATQSQCVAVGSYAGAARGIPLILEWDGTSWDQPLLAAGPRGASLDSVACPTRNDCFAVGGDAQGALIEHFDGQDWTPVGNPLANIHSLLSGSALSSVSCPTATFCSAVGVFSDLQQPHVLARLVRAGAFAGIGPRAVVLSAVTAEETWNGTRWSATLVPFPRPRTSRKSGEENGFDRVACASPTMCTTAGETVDGVLAFDHWDGRSWRAGWPGSSSPTSEPTFSCSAGACLADFIPTAAPRGSGHSDAFDVYESTGTMWAPTLGLLVPADFQTRNLYQRDSRISAWHGLAFACSSAHFCLANGSVSSSPVCGINETYSASWNGVAWVVTIDGRHNPPKQCR